MSVKITLLASHFFLHHVTKKNSKSAALPWRNDSCLLAWVTFDNTAADGETVSPRESLLLTVFLNFPASFPYLPLPSHITSATGEWAVLQREEDTLEFVMWRLREDNHLEILPQVSDQQTSEMPAESCRPAGQERKKTPHAGGYICCGSVYGVTKVFSQLFVLRRTVWWLQQWKYGQLRGIFLRDLLNIHCMWSTLLILPPQFVSHHMQLVLHDLTVLNGLIMHAGIFSFHLKQMMEHDLDCFLQVFTGSLSPTDGT